MTVYATKEFARLHAKPVWPRPTSWRPGDGSPLARRTQVLGMASFKLQVTRQGGGKSGGFRTIVVFKVGQSCFFVHGFAKSDKANVSAKELQG